MPGCMIQGLVDFLSIDPKQKKFPANAPFSFVDNKPVWGTDPDGRDIVVLSAPDNVGGAGHMAVLIQGEDGKWKYYSDNGTTKSSGSKGPSDQNPQKGQNSFKSLKDFANSKFNFEKDDGEVRYTAAFRITTDKDTDEAMRKAAKESVNQDYNLLNNNCADVCSDALNEGDGETSKNLNPGLVEDIVYNSSRAGGPEKVEILPMVPNERYGAIKEKNEGKDVSDQIKPYEWAKEKYGKLYGEKDKGNNDPSYSNQPGNPSGYKGF